MLIEHMIIVAICNRQYFFNNLNLSHKFFSIQLTPHIYSMINYQYFPCNGLQLITTLIKAPLSLNSLVKLKRQKNSIFIYLDTAT